MRGACGVNKMDGESNGSVYRIFAMSDKREGINWAVRGSQTQRWCGHLEKMMIGQRYKSKVDEMVVQERLSVRLFCKDNDEIYEREKAEGNLEYV